MEKKLSDNLRDVKDTARAALHEGRDKIKEVVRGLKDDFGAQFDEKKEKFTALAEEEFTRLYNEKDNIKASICSFIREHPLLSLGAAGLIGAILGKLFLGR